ncbi:hypothetical protein CsatA_000506 [Cannabis sativa]
MVAGSGEDPYGFERDFPSWKNSLGGHPHCYCGDLAYVWTSSSRANPGRRFFGCPHYRTTKVEDVITFVGSIKLILKNLQTLLSVCETK